MKKGERTDRIQKGGRWVGRVVDGEDRKGVLMKGNTSPVHRERDRKA